MPPLVRVARSEALRRLAAGPWDVLVIGGGIVGAGVARDAAMRGMRVALVERTDFAAGTSGKTSKLVHGGLRYLEDFRLGLVRTAIRERDLWLRQEPRLVTPLEFVIPVYRGGDAAWKVRLALRVYAWLARGAGRRARMLSREALAAEEPSLAPPGLRGGGKYMDAAVSDARFVWAVIAAAMEAGATVQNHMEVTGLLLESGRVVGANVTDSISGERGSVRARIVVNAAGPWLDRVRALAVNSKPALRPTKGIHILVPRDRIGNRHAAALRASDGRLFFVIPWGAFSLIGTTDTDYRGDPDAAQATDADVAYLLAAANLAFPNARLAATDVVSTYAGVRPLIDSGRPAQESDISREHELLDDIGMMSVAGGKLTTYRAMAEEVVDAIAKRLGGNFGPCRTADVPLRLPPDPRAADELRALVAKPELIDRLLAWYDPTDLLEHVAERPETAQVLAPEVPYIWAEVDHAVQHEMACTLADVLVRRTWLIHAAPDHARGIAPSVAARMGTLLGWDGDRLRAELAAYESEVARCVPAQTAAKKGT